MRRDAGGCLSERLPRAERLRHQREFSSLRERGRREVGRFMILVWDHRVDARRVGIAVGKAVGSSVVRSKMRRWLRESYRRKRGHLVPAHMLFIARPAIAHAVYADVSGEMERLCRRAKLWRDTPEASS